MKRTSTLIFTLFLVLAMFLGLTACAEKVTLANQTVSSLSFDVPSDFNAFADKDTAKVATNKDSTASISISAPADSQGTTPAEWDKDTYTQSMSKSTDISFIDFDNNATVAGVPALYAHYTSKNSSGVAVETYVYILYPDNGTFQTISFSFSKDSDNSLKTNIDAIKNSIAYK